MAKARQTPKSSTKARASAPPEASADTAAPSSGGEDALPGKEEIARLLAPIRAFMEDARLERVRGFLRRLAEAPPQVLLLEGGDAAKRHAASLFWALLLNCRGHVSEAMLPGLAETLPATPEKEGAPCLACPMCRHMACGLHRDFFFLDGRSASIKIDDVRALFPVLGEPPREANHRVIIFCEAQSIMEAAANALLKSFEEPRPQTSFVLLAPQRERLLPTLVSRSLVLTLPWPGADDEAPPQSGAPGAFKRDSPLAAFDQGEPDAAFEKETRESLGEWEKALCLFLRSGRGWFQRTGVKGTVTPPLVHAINGLLRRVLVKRILAAATGRPPGTELEELLSRLPEPRLRMLDEALAECQESLIYTVNPALVLDWLVTRLYLLLPR